MKQLRNYGDERNFAYCVFCGGETGTRDHCPSRVFLDEPYPDNLPVVPSCSACNSSFSADEEYLACLVSCVVAGSTDPNALPRKKIMRILRDKPSLRALIEKTRSASDRTIVFKPDIDRVVAVATKLAQGHAFYELHETCLHTPDKINFIPLSLMNANQRDTFEFPKPSAVWPEVGSRAMQRLVTGIDLTYAGWIDVQPGRYRFYTSVDGGIDVRIVIHEYLAFHIAWVQ